MLKFHGHTFTDTAYCACCVGDARKIVVDPTNTRKLRTTFKSALTQKWAQLRVLTKEMIVTRDLLGLKSDGLLNVVTPAIAHAESKVNIFQRWFDMALQNAVLQKDGSFMRRYLNAAYAQGTSFGQQQAKTQMVHVLSGQREGALQALARVELEGIIEAVSQQTIRAIADALLTNAKPMVVLRKIYQVIDKVGRNRSEAMIELLVVRAHSEATLDVYEASGLKAVGLLPEARAVMKVVTDAQTQPKAQTATSAEDARRKGPGSRISRHRPPSQRTIRRIRAAELRVAKALGEHVNVRTAGDNLVCPICEGISEEGPYTINRARSLIPAHPHCRCVFIPADDARFAQDYNPYHVASGEHGGEFTSGEGEGGGGYSQKSINATIAELKKDAPNYFGDRTFTDDEIESINGYVKKLDPKFGKNRREGFEAINSSLRRTPSYRTKTIDNLDHAIAKSIVPHDTTVYRGMGNTMAKRISTDWQEHQSSSFSDNAFVSTSANKKAAQKFSKNIIEIKLKKGAHALPITWNGEAEILMGRAHKFRVKSVKKTSSGYIHVTAEIDA